MTRALPIVILIGAGLCLALVLLWLWQSLRHLLLGPGSSKTIWLYRIALQLGTVRPSPGLLALVAVIGVLEELVWRGLVLTALTDSVGSRRAWPVAALFYAAAHLPTVLTLGDPQSGPNPLLAIAALGAGLVWGFAARVFGRFPRSSFAPFYVLRHSVVAPRFT
jgi:membrane protease YdiL (CAAX protease family)